MRNKIARTCVFALGYLLLTLVLGELAVRAFWPKGGRLGSRTQLPDISDQKMTGSRPAIREESERFHHNLIPNTKAVMFRGEENLPPIDFEINSIGIRGPEIPEKRPGERLLLLLGDSIIEARLNRFDNTLGPLLEKKIANENYRVVHHGVSNWSPLLELNWYLKIGRNLKPDMVVLFLVLNDFYRAEIYAHSDAAYELECVKNDKKLPQSFRLKKVAAPATVKEKQPMKFMERLGRTSRFLSLCASAIKTMAEKRLSQRELNHVMKLRPEELEKDLTKLFDGTREADIKKDILRMTRPVKLWDDQTARVVAGALENVKKLKEEIWRDGGRLVVTFVPLGWNFKQEMQGGKRGYQFKNNLVVPMGGIEQKIQEFCRASDIPYLDLYNGLKKWKSENRGKLYFYLDGHWNATGNKVVSEIIAQALFGLK